MGQPAKRWQRRLDSYPHLPNVKPVPDAMRARRGDGTIATPSPREVDAAMRGVLPQLEREGHAVVRHGKRYFVEGFDQGLV